MGVSGPCDASESAAGWVCEVAGGHGWSAPGCLEDCAECSGCVGVHAVALDTFVKERVNADAARMRDGASYAAGVVVLAEEHLYRGEACGG